MPSTYNVHRLDATNDLSKVRAPTSTERSLIQTFPESYGFCDCMGAVEQQIGNSVPPMLAKAVARAIVRTT